ncbi:ARS binding protein 2-domain-containing protein [Geopyxis carbonaria]|nr:ARS binding protein 2-domain-containing protein [Geopyxis carbonaria]
MDAEQYSNALAGHEPEEEEDVDSTGFVVQGIGAGGHHDHSQNDGSGFAHAGFGQANLSIDPSLETDHQHQQQHHQDAHSHGHGHGHVENHYGETQMQRQIYTDIARSANQYPLHTPSEHLSEASPSQFASASPAPNIPKIMTDFTPSDRSLPDKQVTDDNIDDAYVAFILYCNPSVPLECDTSELRKVFRQPPKSDGKTFNVYNLLKLIEKFERKDIKTWTKLAMELGVERTPDSSAQKVQQYAVRLKRWMHAMHVDAFFEYILNKPHAYYREIPSADPDSTPAPEKIRDGVPVEEDLALRALHPETRPKRGRRKTDDKEDNSEKDMPPAKRQHLDTGTPSGDAMGHFGYPNSAIPSSAGPDGMEGFLEDAVSQDQWTAATHSVLSGGPETASTPTGGQQFRWRAYSKMDPGATPQSAHPAPNLLSANDNGTPHPNDDAMTPTTATTPTSSSKPARRRRHGPAVSSAWPSSSNPLTGKLRGRPPSNRSIRDGPFSTFPANPLGKASPTVDLSSHTVSATPTPTPIASHAPQSFATFRPQGLHLTVPQHPNPRPIAMASPAVDHAPNGHLWPLPPPTTTPDPLEPRLAVAILKAAPPAHIHIQEAKAIAHKLLAAAALPPPLAAALAGGFDGLKVHRLQSELEELGLHDPDDDDPKPPRERRYRVAWETAFGALRGEFSQVVVLAPERGDGGAGAAFGGEGGGGQQPAGEAELRKRVGELEKRLREREREIRGIRDGVLRAVV